jgi:hypothetical protein
MTAKINNAADYIAAVGKRLRLERILRQEAQQFHGYGRELFESGLSNTLKRLDAAISEYELVLGYTSIAPYNSWTSYISNQSILIAGTVEFKIATISVAAPEAAGASYFQRTPSVVRSTLVDVPVGTEAPSSLLLQRTVPVGAQ